MNANDLAQAMRWRYAAKKFDSEKAIDEATWNKLKEILVLSPSAFGLQPWRFMDIRDQEIRRQLREVSWNQAQVTDASRYLVFTARKDCTSADVERHLANLCKIRGMERSAMDGYAERIDSLVGIKDSCEVEGWLDRQTYIALGIMIASAAVLGIDTCPIEGMDPIAYDRILKLESTPYETVCGLALGYRKDDPYAEQPKVRFPADEVIVTV